MLGKTVLFDGNSTAKLSNEFSSVLELPSEDDVVPLVVTKSISNFFILE